MPSRRRSIEQGQPADAPQGKAAPVVAAPEKRRSIPRPNLETAIRWVHLEEPWQPYLIQAQGRFLESAMPCRFFGMQEASLSLCALVECHTIMQLIGDQHPS